MCEYETISEPCLSYSRATYLGESLDGLESSVVDLGSKSLEFALVDKVGVLALGELGDGRSQGGIAGAILELDDVLAGDDLDAAGLDDRGAAVDRAGGGCQRQRQQGEESRREEHLGRLSRAEMDGSGTPQRLGSEEYVPKGAEELEVDVLVIGSGS